LTGFSAAAGIALINSISKPQSVCPTADHRGDHDENGEHLCWLGDRYGPVISFSYAYLAPARESTGAGKGLIAGESSATLTLGLLQACP